MTENKRFVYCFGVIEDKWETVEEYKYTPCTKDGFQDLCEMLNELHEENQRLKERLYQREMAKQRRIDYDEFWSKKIKHLAWKRVDVE